MDTHPKTAERPAIAADFTATTGLVSWYPQALSIGTGSGDGSKELRKPVPGSNLPSKRPLPLISIAKIRWKSLPRWIGTGVKRLDDLCDFMCRACRN
jgi:hypothetical protein